MIGFFLKILLLFLSLTPIVHGYKLLSSEKLSKSYGVYNLKSLPFEDCGSKYDIVHLSISSCESIPCQMKRGTVVNVNVIFNDDDGNTSFLKNHVRWIFNAVRTDATISPDPCDGVQQCITAVSNGKRYTTEVYVNDSLPVMGGEMVWVAQNAANVQVLCFQVPVILIS